MGFNSVLAISIGLWQRSPVVGVLDSCQDERSADLDDSGDLAESGGRELGQVLMVSEHRREPDVINTGSQGDVPGLGESREEFCNRLDMRLLDAQGKAAIEGVPLPFGIDARDDLHHVIRQHPVYAVAYRAFSYTDDAG